MAWIAVKFRVPHLIQEAVVNYLFELGAGGVSEEAEGSFSAYFTGVDAHTIEGSLGKYLASLSAIHPKLEGITYSTQAVEDENWAEGWKRHFRAQPINHTFFLQPIWDLEAHVPAEMISIVLESVQGFGTGLHPSTKLAIGFVEKALELEADPSRVNFLDIGTGSGILAIVASKLGVGRIVALDNDPAAVESAGINLGRNHCVGVELLALDVAQLDLRDEFRLVVSNILFETHLKNRDRYAQLVAEGGQLILSGLLANEIASLKEAFMPCGWKVDSYATLTEWAAISLRRTCE